MGMSVILFVVLCIVSLLKSKITHLILLFKNEEKASAKSVHTRGHSTTLTVGSLSLRPTAEPVQGSWCLPGPCQACPLTDNGQEVTLPSPYNSDYPEAGLEH